MDKDKINIDELLKKVDTRFHLVHIAAKRTREIIEGSDGTIKIADAIKKSLEEIIEDKLKFRSGIEEGRDEGKQREPEKVEGKVQRVSGGRKGR